MSSSCSLLLLSGGRMLKKTFNKSRLSPDTLDRVKIGVMLQNHNKTLQKLFFCDGKVNFGLLLMGCLNDAPRRLGKLLGGNDSIICSSYQHGHLVASGLLENALELSDRALHCVLGAQVHFTHHDEDGHLQCHSQTQVLPCCTR